MAVMIVAHPIPGFSGRVAVEEVGLNFIGGFTGPTDVPTDVQAQLVAEGFTLNASPSVGHPLAYVTHQELEDPDSEPSLALRAAFGLVINVKSAPYNARGDGTTNDTAAIQAALDAVPAAGAVVFFPAGDYSVPNGGLTSANPVQLLGVPGLDGTGSRITVTADAVTGLVMNGAASVIEDLQVHHPISGTRSASLIGVQINNANFSKMDNCRIDGFSTNLKVTQGIYYSIINSSFRDFVRVGLDYSNSLAGGDAGDGTIQNCTFDRGSDTVIGGTCVLWHSGGGMRFENNKINGKSGGGAYFEHGLRLIPDSGVGTGLLLVVGNSIENFTGTGVSLTVGSGSFYNSIVISGNEISGLSASSTSVGISLDNIASGVPITGNHIYTVGVGIDVQNVRHCSINGNTLTGITSTGIRVRDSARDVVIGRQPIDVLTGGVDVAFDKPWAIADPFYEKTIPFGGNNGSNMTPIVDGVLRDLFEITMAPFTNVILDIDITGTVQGAGAWVVRRSRMIAGNSAGADLSAATIGTDYTFQGTVASAAITTTGLAGKVRVGVQKLQGTDLSGHVRISARGTGLVSFKQLERYN